MRRILFKQCELLVRSHANVLGQFGVMLPKARGSNVSHNLRVFPFRCSAKASSASASNLPALASRAMSRSQSHSRISSNSASESFSIARSISWTVLMSRFVRGRTVPASRAFLYPCSTVLNLGLSKHHFVFLFGDSEDGNFFIGASARPTENC